MTADTLLAPRDLPWYRHGAVTKLHDGEKLDTLHALREAGLDWDVELRPAMFRGADGRLLKVEDRYVSVRVDNDEPLGVVGRNYKTWLNRDAFAFVDGLLDGGLVLDSAGSYRGGKRIFLVAKLGEEIQVAGEDAYGLYLFLVTSHDGTMAIKAVVTPVRLACTNMTNLALRSAVTTWSVRHTSTAEGRLQEAREALKLTFKASAAFEREMEYLLKQRMTDEELRTAVSTVLPKAKSREEKVEQVVALFNESPTIEAYRGTRYAGLNAFTEWLDWGREVKAEHARFEVSFDGYGARQRDSLYKILAAA